MSFIIILLFILLYQTGIIQSIELSTIGLINRSLILGLLLFATSIIGILILYGKMNLEDLGLKGKDLPLAIVIGIVIWISVQIIEGIIGYVRFGMLVIDPLWNTESSVLIGLLIAMVFGIALFEETGFRGFLLIQFNIMFEKPIRSKSLRIILALFFSQIFFTLIHLPWKVYIQGWTESVFFDLIFSVFLNGIIFGLFYLRTRNLFFVMFVHALGNAPTSLFQTSIQPSILILILAILIVVIWPIFVKKNAEINI
ncbi:MAG: lysostaphin resistance A-like protein [Candidatus Hodarchaeota archaeon]